MPGKNWKCRGCGQYNKKTNVACMGCGHQMQVLTGGGSSSLHPEDSYDNVPPRGYGDGYGGYGTYGASPSRHGKGWHAQYGTDGRWKDDVGYGPLNRAPSRSSYSQIYPGAYGTRGKGKVNIVVDGSKGKGKGMDSEGNVYI